MKNKMNVFLAVLLTAIILLPLSAKSAQKVVPRSQAGVQLSYAPLVKRARPAVVNIYTRKVVQKSFRTPFFDDPFFKRFFGNAGKWPCRD